MAAPQVAVRKALLEVAERLACPSCGSRPTLRQSCVSCGRCGASYAIVNGVLDLRPPGLDTKDEEMAWSKHWASGNQASLAQRFFSVYRKSVFARAVSHFVDRYFPPTGVFVEAGCGTAETSMRIDKRAGGRTLIALDLIVPVLEQAHPMMDVRMAADIFRMPFQNHSLDGVWNVGVMEHFTHEQIDQILGEFRRVLRPGGRVILLWPALYSPPQRLLRTIEWFVNRRREEQDRFLFHPPEISQLRSVRQGREVLRRNDFEVVHIDPGFRSLGAFQTLVGEKPRDTARPAAAGKGGRTPVQAQK